jgi:drug/metabolite transporter (DMT)-like permease
LNNSSLLFVGSAVLLIVSNVAYHTSQKSVPSTVNPLESIICTFFIALALSVVLLPLFTDINNLTFRHFNWANLLSGISIVGIVVGHVLYYRAGWSLSSGTLFSYVAICILLVPVGLLLFHERISLYKISGFIVSVIGLYLITRD